MENGDANGGRGPKKLEGATKLELIEEALLKHVSGGVNTCGHYCSTSGGHDTCCHDTCYTNSGATRKYYKNEFVPGPEVAPNKVIADVKDQN